jgi:hypothetical protein
VYHNNIYHACIQEGTRKKIFSKISNTERHSRRSDELFWKVLVPLTRLFSAWMGAMVGSCIKVAGVDQLVHSAFLLASLRRR